MATWQPVAGWTVELVECPIKPRAEEFAVLLNEALGHRSHRRADQCLTRRWSSG
jgi:hypothetical protein